MAQSRIAANPLQSNNSVSGGTARCQRRVSTQAMCSRPPLQAFASLLRLLQQMISITCTIATLPLAAGALQHKLHVASRFNGVQLSPPAGTHACCSSLRHTKACASLSTAHAKWPSDLTVLLQCKQLTQGIPRTLRTCSRALTDLLLDLPKSQ